MMAGRARWLADCGNRACSDMRQAPDPLTTRLHQHIDPTVVLDDLVDRQQWSGDASIYHLLPRVVVLARHAADVQAVLQVAGQLGVPVCFRAGGTSLSGQAVTDGILVVVSRHLRSIVVDPQHDLVTCEPGAIGAWVNNALAPLGRRIGPDPASMQAAQIGGIVANNASGMCCGIAENSYHTVTALDLVLSDGYRIDTGHSAADERLRRDRPLLADGLAALRVVVRNDPALCQRITTAFATKNTVGYSLNAFLDADSPVQILQRLIIGAEGTLAFIAAATLRTFALPQARATGWLLFKTIEQACDAVGDLRQAGAAAIELMDSLALQRVAHELPHQIPLGEPAALLIEFQCADPQELAQRIRQVTPLLLACDLAAPAFFSTDPHEQARYWKVRKGLFPSVGAQRAAGTAVVIEDVTFPVDQLAAGVRALRSCFLAHGYADAVIFGHAKDGNLHFTLTPDLSAATDVARYDRFMRAMVDLVLARGGHLKAEHGTGRNMAPFVTRQWGEQAVGIMRRIKALLDPGNILNPGVLLSDDPQAHLRHLKSFAVVDPMIDHCSECGFCESVCPSRDLTYSPRQRISALRAIAQGGVTGAAVQASWKHRGLDSCAADGMCATVCPLHINTGSMVTAQRATRRSGVARSLAQLVADHIGIFGSLLRVSLRAAHAMEVTRIGAMAIPLPTPALPLPLPPQWPVASAGEPTAIYLPSCISQLIGKSAVPQHLAQLCTAAGIGLIIPDQAAALCCGQAFSSKGFPRAAAQAASRSIQAVLAASAATAPWVVSDTSSCAAHLAEIPDDDLALSPADRLRWRTVTRFHPAAFAHEVLVPRLVARGRLQQDALPTAIHPTCAEMHAGWQQSLVDAAQATCAHAFLPAAYACCGMAGDKGWTMPALTAAATAREAHAVNRSVAKQGVTTSATCALAMSAATGTPYHHLFALLAQALIVPQP
jgi:D-lactate dehydrogenase